jgi:hypothetical protein
VGFSLLPPSGWALSHLVSGPPLWACVGPLLWAWATFPLVVRPRYDKWLGLLCLLILVLPWAKIEFVFLLLFSPLWTIFRCVSMFVLQNN